MNGEFSILLLVIIFLTACASATSDKPAPANRAQSPQATEIEQKKITDTLQYEANFKDQLLSVLYAYDKTRGTNFRQTPITEIEGVYALSLLKASHGSDFPGDDPLLQHADKLLQRPGARAAIADVPDSANFPSGFLFIPTPIGEPEYSTGVVLNLGHPSFRGFEIDEFSDSPTLTDFPPLKNAQPKSKHVVFFGSPDCMAGERMRSLLSRLPQATQNQIYFVDVFEDSSLAKSLGLVPAVPTLVVFDPAGAPQDIFYGGGDMRQVRHFMARNGFLEDAPNLSTRIRSHGETSPARTLSTIHHVQSEDLQGLDLRGSSLFRATFGGVDLRGADLRDSDLRKAIFAHSNLKGANLSNVRLEGTHFWNSICPDGTSSQDNHGCGLQNIEGE